MLMVYMAILKKRFADAGLRDALVQSSIIAEGSVDMALQGKNYKRGIRMYKTFYEVLMRLLLTKLQPTSNFLIEDIDKDLGHLYERVSLDTDFHVFYQTFLKLKQDMKI